MSLDPETIDTEDPRQTWPNATKAAKVLGVSKTKFEKLAKEVELEYVLTADGERLFNPTKITEYTGIYDDEQLEQAKVVNKHLLDTTKMLCERLEKVLKLSTDPADKVITHLLEDNKNLREKYGELQTKYIEGIEAFESALTQAHEREMAAAVQKTRDERMGKVLDVALGMAPELVAQAMSAVGKKAAFSKLTNSLSEEQLTMLMLMVNDEQKQILKDILGKRAEDAAKAADSQTPKDTQGETKASEVNKEN